MSLCSRPSSPDFLFCPLGITSLSLSVVFSLEFSPALSSLFQKLGRFPFFPSDGRSISIPRRSLPLLANIIYLLRIKTRMDQSFPAFIDTADLQVASRPSLTCSCHLSPPLTASLSLPLRSSPNVNISSILSPPLAFYFPFHALMFLPSRYSLPTIFAIHHPFVISLLNPTSTLSSVKRLPFLFSLIPRATTIPRQRTPFPPFHICFHQSFVTFT